MTRLPRRPVVAFLFALLVAATGGASLFTTVEPSADARGALPMQLGTAALLASVTPDKRGVAVNFAAPTARLSAFAPNRVSENMKIATKRNASLADLAATPACDGAREPAKSVHFANLPSTGFSGAFVDPVDAPARMPSSAARMPFSAAVNSSAFSFLVPRNVLGGSDGQADFAVNVGTRTEQTDRPVGGMAEAVIPARGALPWGACSL